MHRLIAIVCFVSASFVADEAAARTYKCTTKTGSTVYQSAPCEAAPAPAAQTAAPVRGAETLAGCFELPDRSKDLNRPQIMRKKVLMDGARAVLVDGNTKKLDELRPATTEELQAASLQFKMRIDDGLVSTAASDARAGALYRSGNRFFGEFAPVSAPAIRADCNW